MFSHHDDKILLYFSLEKDRCKHCQGRKTVKERKILEVHIVKGMRDGQKITFNSEGDQEPGIEPGDIIIILDEKEHPVFKRDDLDLHIKLVGAFHFFPCYTVWNLFNMFHLQYCQPQNLTQKKSSTSHPGLIQSHTLSNKTLPLSYHCP